MKWSERMAADRRLVICRTLNDAPEYRANSSIIHGIVREIGHSVPRDTIQADLDWMADVGVVDIDELGVPGLRIVTLTQRGVDVATGATVVTGIARPSPGR